jgi:hypothetical protein
MEEKKISNTTLIFLLGLAVFLDGIEILETLLDLALGLGLLIFIITTLVNLFFYVMLLFNGLLKRGLSLKKQAPRLISYFAGLIGENIPVIEVLPLNTIAIGIIIIQERPDWILNLLKFTGGAATIAEKLHLIPGAEKIKEAVSKAREEVEKMEVRRKRKIGEEEEEVVPMQLIKRAKMLEQPQKALIFLLISSLIFPLITKAQFYDFQDYSKILEPLFRFSSPQTQEIQPKIESKENIIYISLRKVAGGVMVGVEPIIFENGKQLSSKDFVYKIQIPEISLETKEFWNNIGNFYTFNPPSKITVKVNLVSLKSDQTYKGEKFFMLPEPKVVIVNIDPITNLISPLNPFGRFLTAIPFYFTSDKLDYLWSNGSSKPMIEIGQEKEIWVEVKNRYNSSEKARQSVILP